MSIRNEAHGPGPLFAVLVVLALVTASQAATPVAADASVGCYGDYCSGQDPAASGCAADAQTVAFNELPGALLELRWSPVCKTNWARYTQYPRGWYLGAAPVALRAVQDTGYTQTNDLGINGVPEGTTIWSSMIYSPVHRVRAEVVVQCGGPKLLETAFDCGTNGVMSTAAK